MVEVRTRSRLRVRRKLDKPIRSRKLYQVVGVSSGTEMRVHNNCVTNVLRGILERVLLVPTSGGFSRTPRPLFGAYSTRLAKFKARLLSVLHSTAKMSVVDFVNSYHGRKRTIYERAADSLSRDCIRTRDADIKIFGKAEKHNVSRKPDPIMRMISPRDPRYNIEVGVYIKPLEHQIYRAIADCFKETTVTKGLNAEQTALLLRSKWSRYNRPRAVGLDANRFDQHVSVDALTWEHSVYLAAYRNDRKLQQLLSWQLVNKCTARCPDGTIKYTVRGTRMSGDMNTALGNCLIMCALLYSYADSLGLLKKLSFVNNGDDCVAIGEAHDIDRFTQTLVPWFLDMGFSMAVEPTVSIFEKIEFCQCQPVFDGHSWIMVRQPSVAMAKDSYSIKPLDSRSIYQKWVGAVGECGASLSGGIPINQEFYQCFIRASHGRILRNDLLLDTGFHQMARGLHRRVGDITPAARASFALAFDIIPDLQLEIERLLAKFTPEWCGAGPTDEPSVGCPWVFDLRAKTRNWMW